MSRATEAYDRLTLEMAKVTPNCLGDDRFTSDELSNAEVAVLAAICDTCALYELCHRYAELEKPKAGVWAGRRFRSYKPRSGVSDE